MEIPKPFWIVMVVLGACARLVPHPWNFTPMMTIGLFAGSHARKLSTINGLSACFLAGIPFYRNQILGDAYYTVAIFGGYALIQRLGQPTGEAA
jgi:hypothetical protein